MKSPYFICWSSVFLLLLFCLPALRAEESLSLAGKWHFSRDEASVGLREKWYDGEFKTAGDGPTEISLPGTTDEAKAGIPNPKQPSLDGLYRPNVYIGPAWYQREIDISFLPVFWSPIWIKSNPGTMGILCDPHHPAFSLFPTDSYSDWQWWDLIDNSRSIDLGGTPQSFRPIIQVIDNFSRQKKLGNLFETRVGKGRLLVCTIDLRNKLAGNPAGIQLLRSLYAYVGSDTFQPTSELTAPVLDDLLNAPCQLEKMGAKVMSCDSAAPGYSPANAIDGNMDTIWHTVWTPTPAPLPHYVAIDLGADVQVKGVTYLARQDVSNGRADECEVFLSDDPSHWNSQPAATVHLKDIDELQTITFKAPASGRYLKFVVKGVYGKDPIAAVAELDILK